MDLDVALKKDYAKCSCISLSMQSGLIELIILKWPSCHISMFIGQSKGNDNQKTIWNSL